MASTDEGDVVLDPYMGTGTVAVVARDHKRHFIGAELDGEYHAVALQRLSGLPDANNCFPNLKTLRDYIERTGEPIEKFRFSQQISERATERGQAKIYPEPHHLLELEERLLYEEAAFAADLRGNERPVDEKLNGGGKTPGRSSSCSARPHRRPATSLSSPSAAR